MKLNNQTRVAVVGLGYVGLPLAVALAQHYDCVGFDVSADRIDELKRHHDRTAEVDSARLAASSLSLTSDPGEVGGCDFYIVTVPTPIDDRCKPDLSIVEAASRSVGSLLPEAVKEGRKPIVIYESTVYPGVTEEVCAPILETESGLAWGDDFNLGYSPERINPGDREHTIDKITKVVSGDTPETLRAVAALYDAITSGGVFRCATIKTAEAAKVIENAQRDINIAFMNEITQIFGAMDMSVWDVLAAARTKWNFLPFTPGLVGGHCIGVDPYYLAHRAGELGVDPKVILSSRSVNDGMSRWVAKALTDRFEGKGKSILVLGTTFKENVPDIRNSKVADLVHDLRDSGFEVTLHDPLADAAELRAEYDLALDPDALDRSYDCILLAVAHREYVDMGIEVFRERLNDGGQIADLKGAFSGQADWNL